VVDAAGAIYVIGGQGGTGYFQDVWKSTDGGAELARGCSGGTGWVLKGYWGLLGGILEGYSGSTRNSYTWAHALPRTRTHAKKVRPAACRQGRSRSHIRTCIHIQLFFGKHIYRLRTPLTANDPD
jgi:hypothetical protein